jgi:hypothetical protein
VVTSAASSAPNFQSFHFFSAIRVDWRDSRAILHSQRSPSDHLPCKVNIAHSVVSDPVVKSELFYFFLPGAAK